MSLRVLPQVIGISGLPNAGKDTTADHLILNYGYKKLSLASPIREVIYSTFKLDTSRMYEREYESKALYKLGDKSIKTVLQIVGKTFTDIYDQVWVDATFENLDLRYKWVIADVRRPCEMQKIKEVGGMCIYIHSNRPLPKDGRDMGHESESYHDYLRTNANYHLLNDHPSVGAYYTHVDDLMNDISTESFTSRSLGGL